MLTREGVSYTWETAKARVVNRIKELSEEYPIDTNRIYLIGFSMGGSGSYIIAEHLYKKENLFFAGLIRIAGKSQTKLSTPIMEKTSIWYHVGLSDSEDIINIAEESLIYAEGLYKNYQQVQHVDNTTNCKRTTKIVIADEKEIYRLSKYEGIGHSDKTVFKDETLFSWLMSKKIE